jgi:uncharacterized membrane protein (UPF0127 family)
MKVLRLLACIALFTACMHETPTVVIHAASGDYRVTVEVAERSADQARGLMYRQYLKKDSGMLFIFQQEGLQSFWMKNTLIPLDMLFISSDLVIVDIATMQPCTLDPCPSYTSKQPAQYCLEVNAGYVRSHAIKIGDTIFSDVIRPNK